MIALVDSPISSAVVSCIFPWHFQSKRGMAIVPEGCQSVTDPGLCSFSDVLRPVDNAPQWLNFWFRVPWCFKPPSPATMLLELL